MYFKDSRERKFKTIEKDGKMVYLREGRNQLFKMYPKSSNEKVWFY